MDANARGLGYTPLIIAVRFNMPDTANLLLTHHADVNQRDASENPALYFAVAKPSLEMVNMLLQHGPEVDVPDYRGWTPLESAVANNQTDIATKLLEAGANPNIILRTSDSSLIWLNFNSMLEVAVKRMNLPLAEALLAHGANPNLADNGGTTPIAMVKIQQANPQLNQKQVEDLDKIYALLRNAKADENLQRLSSISVTRNGAPAKTVFLKGTNIWNHYTLLDLLAQFYAPRLRWVGFTRKHIADLRSAWLGVSRFLKDAHQPVGKEWPDECHQCGCRGDVEDGRLFEECTAGMG